MVALAGAFVGGFFWGRHQGYGKGYRSGSAASKGQPTERTVVMPLLLATDLPAEPLLGSLGWTTVTLGVDPAAWAELLNTVPSPDPGEGPEGHTLAAALADGAAPSAEAQAEYARDLLAAGRTQSEARRRLYTQVRYHFDTGSATVLGPDTATVEIVWWNDFQCPYCARAWPMVKELLVRYPDQVRIVVMNLPLRNHREADEAAAAAWAADQQGRFVEMADLLFDKRRKLKRHVPEDGSVALEKLAGKVGLDLDAYRTDYASVQELVEAQRSQAREAGVTSVPSFYIDGTRARVRVNATSFGEYIDRILAGDDPAVAP